MRPTLLALATTLLLAGAAQAGTVTVVTSFSKDVTEPVKKAFTPFIKLARGPMWVVSVTVGSVIAVILMPFKMIIRLLRRPAAS